VFPFENRAQNETCCEAIAGELRDNRRRMGKLAERYVDASRSGVYRVRDTTVPRAAAAEAGLRMVEASAAALADGGWEAFMKSLPGPAVVLIEGAEALAGREYSELVEALEALARSARARGESFFAVMVDAPATLALPRLYKERE
jgi:hypothetical protein